MRKLIVSMATSLDGYVEGPAHDVMALPFDDGFSAYNLLRLRAADVSLLGRRSFEQAREYWPPVAHDHTQNATEQEISRRNTAIDKVVISDSLRDADTSPWSESTRIVRRAEAVDVVRDLKAGGGGDIITFGSRTMWSPLLVAGLVNELHVLVGPALLGTGTPLFDGSERVSLRLLEAQTLPDSQLVLLRYEPVHDR